MNWFQSLKKNPLLLFVLINQVTAVHVQVTILIHTHFSASVCCSLMPTLKCTGWTLSSMPLWISRGNASNMATGRGMRTLKPSRLPVMMGSISRAELPVAWVTFNITSNVSICHIQYAASICDIEQLSGTSSRILASMTEIIFTHTQFFFCSHR